MSDHDAGYAAAMVGAETCYVYLRNILTNTWSRFDVGHWADAYRQFIADGIRIQMQTYGGELTVMGTAESGRVTIIDASGESLVVDCDWYTLTVSQALGREPSGIVDVPQSVRRP